INGFSKQNGVAIMFTRLSSKNSPSLPTRRAFLALGAVFAFHAIGTGTQAQARDTALGAYEPGTIVVKTGERKLYLVLGNGQTISYPVAVGKSGKTWTGVKY